MNITQKGLRTIVYKKIFFIYLDLNFIIRFIGECILESYIILLNIKKDSNKYNLSPLSIMYNALIKYPLLGFCPVDFFCYKLFENNYKDYISQIDYLYKIVRINYYKNNTFNNKLLFKQVIIKKINTPKLVAYYDHKKDKIEKFADPNTDKIVIKPTEGYWGKNIKIVNSENLIEDLKKCKKSSIAEEFVHQHHMLNDIFSGSVNTMRIITLKKNGKIVVLTGTLKAGKDPGIIVDNVAKGGIGINIDLKTGILGSGYTSYNHGFIEYKSHPKTNYKFFGKTIPYLDDVKELAIAAHQYFPSLKIIGWDIAITENGPTLIEGNRCPEITGMQLHEPLREKLLY